MRVAYDDEIFTRQRQGGVSRVFSELIREFREDPTLGVEPVFDFGIHRNDHLNALNLSGVRAIKAGSVLDRRRLAQTVSERVFTRRRTKSDVLHLTYYSLRALGRADGRPVVCSLHDMIPELHPELTHATTHGAKLSVLRRCDLILCGSETARADLETLVHGLDAEIRVCPYGTRPRQLAEPPVERDAATVLYVGGRLGYKNFSVLLDALNLAGAAARNGAHGAHCANGIELLCVGGGPLTRAELERISALNASVRVRQIDADDTTLETLYGRVTLFVATSLAEGFGLPVLEAMSAGCPVAISNIAAFREVVGDAGLFHAPNDPDALADNIMSVIGDPAVSADLAGLARARSLRFTWRRSAELTAEAYRTLLP